MIVQLRRGETAFLVHHILGVLQRLVCVEFVSIFNVGGEIKRDVSDQQISTNPH